MKHKDHKLYATTSLAAFGAFALVALGTAAQAQGVNQFIDQAQSTKSRDEVRAELAQARADGSIRATAGNYDFVAAARPQKSRDDVRRELQHARTSGELAAINAEAHDFTGAPMQRVAQR
jgi:hypothetical protein